MPYFFSHRIKHCCQPLKIIIPRRPLTPPPPSRGEIRNLQDGAIEFMYFFALSVLNGPKNTISPRFFTVLMGNVNNVTEIRGGSDY